MAAGPTPAGPGRVFISYRRDDSAFPAGWLYDRLSAHVGNGLVFKDVDSIEPGDDFVRVLEDAVGSCQVLLALIGDRWLDIIDETGQRRLDNPDDFVRLEIEAALRRDVRVVPVLVGRAPMPKSEQLPDSLRGLIRRHAIELSPNRFESDVARLVRTIDKTLAEAAFDRGEQLQRQGDLVGAVAAFQRAMDSGPPRVGSSGRGAPRAGAKTAARLDRRGCPLPTGDRLRQPRGGAAGGEQSRGDTRKGGRSNRGGRPLSAGDRLRPPDVGTAGGEQSRGVAKKAG